MFLKMANHDILGVEYIRVRHNRTIHIVFVYFILKMSSIIKGQMHHHNDLGSKCAYTCHLSNKTTRKSVLLSTPQIWLMKVSKKTSLSLGMEADIAGQLSPIKHNQWYEVTASAASDWLRDISGWK